MAINRVRIVEPEWLDSLAPSDPEAIRSRADLRLINALMGNFAWVTRRLAALPSHLPIIEVGAGEGILLRQLARRHSEREFHAVDLAPAPASLPPNVQWHSGDLFEVLPALPQGILLGVMIVHHFPDETLPQLGDLLRRLPHVLLCEPHRATSALILGTALLPAVGSVTRHDMPISIRAGFRPGELNDLFQWPHEQCRERTDFRGSIRWEGWGR